MSLANETGVVQSSISKIQKHVIRCDAVFHLMKIRAFTKQHLLRIIYLDENASLVCTNALRLEFSSFQTDGENEYEIVYIHLDFSGSRHTLYRSRCFLEKYDESGNYIVKNENVLSYIEAEHLEEIIKTYEGYTREFENFNLTELRKLASRKSNKRVREVILQNNSFTETRKNELENPTDLTEKKTIRHVFELQMHIGAVVFSHTQSRISNDVCVDYLVKNDILSYVEFLKLNQIILGLQIDHQGAIENENSSTSSQKSLMKLGHICDRLAKDREKSETIKKRKRQFHEICEMALRENSVPSFHLKEIEFDQGEMFLDKWGCDDTGGVDILSDCLIKQRKTTY